MDPSAIISSADPIAIVEPPDASILDRQLAHGERDSTRAAYNRAEYLAERRKMMQAWADYLDSLRVSPGRVVPIKHKAA